MGGGSQPRWSGWQLGGPGGEQGQALPVGISRRQRHLDPGGELGHAGGDLDQREADRVELRPAPE